MTLKNVVAETRQKFIIGTGWLGTVISIASLLTFAKVWVSDFARFGIPEGIVYVGLPIVYIVGCFLIGHFYQRFGFYGAEATFNNRKGNPEFMEVYEAVKRIEKKIDEKENK